MVTTKQYDFTRPVGETPESQAARQLGRKIWKETDLKKQAKGHPFKVELARRLREETTMTVAWIARRLSMGTRGHVTHLLYWQGRRKQYVLAKYEDDS